MPWHASSGYAEHFILLTSGKWEWCLLGRLTTQDEVTVEKKKKIQPGFHLKLAPPEANTWQMHATSARQGSFLVSTDRIRLRVHVRMNECICVSAWKSVKSYMFEISVLILRESLSVKATWSVSVIPSWEGKVQEHSVLAEDSVCQANSRAGTGRCPVTPANGTGGHIVSEPETSKILAFMTWFFSLPGSQSCVWFHHLHCRFSFHINLI